MFSPVLSLELLKTLPAEPPLQCDVVSVPEFGPGVVAWVAELSQQEREERIEVPFAAYKARTKQENNVGLRVWSIAAALCKNQSRHFEASDAKDIQTIAGVLAKHGNVTARLFAKLEKLNSLSDEELKEIEKNSPSGDGNGKNPADAGSPAPASGKPA